MALIFGIDPGVHTGFALYDTDDNIFLGIVTCKIHDVIIKLVNMLYENGNELLHVVFEDARLATFYRYGKENQAKARGFGSVARDCKVIEDFCIQYGISYSKKRPNKKMNEWCKDKEMWNKVFGINWTKSTSHHARIAAALAQKEAQKLKFNRKVG